MCFQTILLTNDLPVVDALPGSPGVACRDRTAGATREAAMPLVRYQIPKGVLTQAGGATVLTEYAFQLSRVSAGDLYVKTELCHPHVLMHVLHTFCRTATSQ